MDGLVEHDGARAILGVNVALALVVEGVVDNHAQVATVVTQLVDAASGRIQNSPAFDEFINVSYQVVSVKSQKSRKMTSV